VEIERRPGTVLAGRFVLQEILGRGGSGVVWSALDTMVGDRVAVKILDASVHDPANRERLRREVRATRSGHPNLVSIHELHETDGLLFLTMELVEGPSVRDALAERRSLIVDDVIHIGRQVASALEHLHDQGLVHRDVKPGNIMLAADGAAKLCDMGLARPLTAGVTVTETEMVVGTPTYMAPEMARGELIAASDVYALGLTLYQCLTGDVPLAGTTAVDTFMARQQGRPERVRRHHPTCPRWLDRLIDRMLDPEPKLRPTADQVARALGDGRYGWRPHRRQLRVAGTLLAAAVLGTAAVAFGVGRWGAPPDPAKDATANELATSAEYYDDGKIITIVDGYGRRVQTFTTSVRAMQDKERAYRRRTVAFADLDGDGRQDVVFANPDNLVTEQVELHRRLPSGLFELDSTWNLHHEWEYEGQQFGAFAPRDVECADLDGDGVPEIILVYVSSPYYLAEVLVIRPSGEEVLRVRHPGHLTNVLTGDRDRDGRLELYVGATNNFHEQNVGNSSSPAAFVIETDWSVAGQVLDLFGPGRIMTGTVPSGMEVVYLSFATQTVIPHLTPWKHAAIGRVSSMDNQNYLLVNADRVKRITIDRVSMLRAFRFDRDLRLADGMWVVSHLEERGIDPATTPSGQFDVTYWNGASWQPEVCAIPQAGEDDTPG
jgi:tRNA A-37 threonylcarbamoyl transferase component Bud32